MSNAGTRAERTATKTAVGGLPAPFTDAPVLGIGNGTPCQGCGEPIAPHEKSCTVDLLGALTLDFHTECYESWKTFKRPRPMTDPRDAARLKAGQRVKSRSSADHLNSDPWG
jgi:hypothetical protein